MSLINELLEPTKDYINFADQDTKNSIDVYIEKEHRKYISVAKYINDLYKNIGSGKPLKFTLKYLFENTSLSRVKLYRLKNLNYSLVSPTDNLKYKNTDDLLRHFYDVLDDEQIGTVTSDREPFESFYFEYLEVKNLTNLDLEKSEINTIAEQSSIENPEFMKNNHLINDLSKNQKPSTNCEKIVEELTASNNLIKQHEQTINKLNEQLNELNEQLNEQADKRLYDWQAMNKYIYPPELHLAIIIWEKSYISKEISNEYMTDHSQRFNTIAKKIGLDENIHSGSLFSRLSKITNPQTNKQKGDIENLKSIKGLNIKDLDDSNPQG